MKITALEIRQKSFEKEFRGYNKDEVSAFLLALSQAWEKMVSDNKELKLKLDQAEKEVQKLREVEDSLFKTLKTAETTGANMVEQANRSAELLMKETKFKAEQLYNDAQNKSDRVIALMEDEIRGMEQEYRSLESQKDTLLREIKVLANETLERLNKVSDEKKDLSFIKERAQNVSSELRNQPLMSMDVPRIEPEEGVHKFSTPAEEPSVEETPGYQETPVENVISNETSTETSEPYVESKVENTFRAHVEEDTNESEPEIDDTPQEKPANTKPQGGGSFFDEIADA